MGAAMLAGIGTGLFRDCTDAAGICVREKLRYASDKKWRGIYQEGYGVFRGLYPALRPLFGEATRAEGGV